MAAKKTPAKKAKPAQADLDLEMPDLDLGLDDGEDDDDGGPPLVDDDLGPDEEEPEEQKSREERLEDEEAAMLAAKSKAELEALQGEFLKRARREDNRMLDATDSEYWVAVCFQTRAQKEEWLKKAKLIDLGDKYLNGLHVAGRMGIKIESPSPVWREGKLNKRLLKYT